jgi:hypothetical protein
MNRTEREFFEAVSESEVFFTYFLNYVITFFKISSLIFYETTPLIIDIRSGT